MSTKTHFPLIHNEWVKTQDSYRVTNPYDGSLVAKVFKANGDFFDLAIKSAQNGFKAMRELSSHDRYEILQNIVAGIQKGESKLVDTIVKEGGKPISYAKAELDRAKLTFTWSAEESRRTSGEVLPLDIIPQTRGYIGIAQRFPLGIILAITPFNFPLNLVAHKIGPAIASGNSVILKPAPQTPVTSLILGEIIKSSGIPAGGVNIVPAEGAEAEALVTDGRIGMLSFTGSDRVGWHLKSIAGKKRISLELGGNAAAIVEPDADIGFAIPRLAAGSFAQGGQSCISVQRIYVHKTISKDFTNRFLEEVSKNIRIGDPFDESTIVGPLISEDSAIRAERWIREAVQGGAKILLGGKRDRSFLYPTVLAKTKPDMKVTCEEVFAPVVLLEEYADFDQALKRVNQSHYGLQAGVFTNDVRKIRQAYLKLDVGGVIINDFPTFRVDHMPYGGSKDSGIGREGIKYAIEEMTQMKMLAMRFTE
jgi:acyl-CoA reductase-like NAD-dependent aldehyde dehydrogenase